jgi:hypothetical protein
MLVREVDEISFYSAPRHSFPHVEPKSRGLMLVAVTQTMKQRTGEVHLNLALRVEPH